MMTKILDIDNFHAINANHNFRYERKFTVPDDYTKKEIEFQIKKNRFLFREVFHKRQVNNIYFDTFGYNDYSDNVLGVSDRRKFRIRWYGDTFENIQNPVLEIKIKKGLVGDKWTYKLKPFTLDNTFDNKYIQKIFKQSDLPIAVFNSVRNVVPTLLNSYSRTYYLSANNKFRTTLDFNLLYYKMDSHFNNFNKKPVKDENKIVELKYGLEDDKQAYEVSTQFPFRLNKNSKYVNGVNAFNHFTQ